MPARDPGTGRFMGGGGSDSIGDAYVDIGARTGAFDHGMRNVERRLSRIGSQMATAGRRMTATMTVPLVGIGTMATRAFMKQESAVTSLRAALIANGDDVDRLLPKYEKFASAIQEVTTMGDETTLALMAQIRNLGVQEDALEEATKGAIGLSKALGLASDSAARYTALAMQGEFTVLQRYVPALRTAETEAEKLAIVQDLMAKGFKQAELAAQDNAGQMKQAANAAGDFAESVGGAIAKSFGFKDAASGLKSVFQDLQSRIEGATDAQIRFGTQLAVVAALAGPALFAIGTLAQGVAALSAAIVKAKAVILAHKTAFGVAGAALGGALMGRMLARVRIGTQSIEDHMVDFWKNLFRMEDQANITRGERAGRLAGRLRAERREREEMAAFLRDMQRGLDNMEKWAEGAGHDAFFKQIMAGLDDMEKWASSAAMAFDGLGRSVRGAFVSGGDLVREAQLALLGRIPAAGGGAGGGGAGGAQNRVQQLLQEAVDLLTSIDGKTVPVFG